MKFFSGARIGSRLFCSATCKVPIFSECKTLSELQRTVQHHSSPITVDEAVFVVKQCILLKKANDPKSRGLIPREILTKVSDCILDNMRDLNCVSLVDLAVAVGDNNRCMDEYIMFKLAETISARAHEFSVVQLLEIARVYSKRELQDEALFDAIAATILSSTPEPPFAHLVDLNRSLSRISIKKENLCQLIASRSKSLRNPSVRDVIGCIISFADLDYHNDVVFDMWRLIDSKQNVSKYISKDDQYGLLFAATHVPSDVSYRIVEEIVRNASAKNRIRKRIDLISRCTSLGFLTPKFDKLLCSSAVQDSLPKKTAGCAVSSGLHLEVCNTLRNMRVRYNNEFDLGPFIVDILVRK